MATWKFLGDDEDTAAAVCAALAAAGAPEAPAGVQPDLVFIAPPRRAPELALDAARVLFPAAALVIVSTLVFDRMGSADAVVPPWALDRLAHLLG